MAIPTITERQEQFFLEIIAKVEKQKVTDLVKIALFFSLIMDGSTDSSSVDQEDLYIQASVNGRVFSKFLCIGEPESAGSEDINNFVNEQLKSNDIYGEMKKCVGFGSDGASNMVGVKSGLVTRLKMTFHVLWEHTA